MRILVTGHLGYIGSVLVPMLLRRGHDVVGMDSDLYRDCTFGIPPPSIPSFHCDIRDAEPECFAGVDAVLHLAALSNDPLGDLNPAQTFEINHCATVALAVKARAAGVSRFVFSSSCSNYGSSDDALLDEEAPFSPVTPYAQSKVLAERDVKALADDRFSPVFLRSATAYGVSPRLRFDLVLNNLVAWAYTTGLVRLKSDGSAWRPVVHVEDIGRAFVAVVEAPREPVHNQAFNVGITGENFRIRELAEVVRQVVPGARVEFESGAAKDTRCYRVDCDRLSRRLPAYRPVWTVQAGALQLLEEYQRVGVNVDDFEGVRYRRVDHLRHLLESGAIDATYRWRALAN